MIHNYDNCLTNHPFAHPSSIPIFRPSPGGCQQLRRATCGRGLRLSSALCATQVGQIDPKPGRAGRAGRGEIRKDVPGGYPLVVTEMGKPRENGGLMGFNEIYLLVMTNIAMENHHL